MRILALDDERPALYRLNKAITEAAPDAELHSFNRVSEALAEEFAPDVAFLDIEMPGMTGMELASKIQERNPRVNIIFVTGFSEYALDALNLHASGYIVKPVTAEKIRTELENLRYAPDEAEKEAAPRVRIQCFGNFAAFVDGQPLKTARSKSLELLAYLVDRRGTPCTSEMIADALWEDGIYDRARQQQISRFRRELLHALEDVGVEDILDVSARTLAIRTEAVSCDYYDALGGDPAAEALFLGEYMAPYGWAIYTEGELTQKFLHDE